MLRLQILITRIFYKLFIRSEKQRIFELKLKKAKRFCEWQNLCFNYEIANVNDDSFGRGFIEKQILALMQEIQELKND